LERSAVLVRKIRYFALALPHSDAFFVKAYPAETTEAFCCEPAWKKDPVQG